MNTRTARSALAAVLVAAVAAPLGAQTNIYAGEAAPAVRAFGQVVLVGDGEIVVGEPNNRTRSGVVYVYRRAADGSWTETDRLTAPDADIGDDFGRAMAMEGQTLLVGASDPDTGAGVVHAFRRTGDGWTHAGRIDPPAMGGGDDFGEAIAIAAGLAVIGDPGANDDAGAIHFYRADGGGWTSDGTFAPEGPEVESGFGASLALDGDNLLVGAPGAEDGAGAAFMLRSDGAGAWEVANRVTSPVDGQRGFGVMVHLSGDEALVAARPMGVHVLRYLQFRGQDQWRPVGQLLPYDGGSGFGASLGVTDSEVWIGASGEGAIYVFARGDEPGEWAGTSKLTSEIEGVAGFAASIAVDDGLAVVGATRTGGGSGSVVVFSRGAGGTWMEESNVEGPWDALPSLVGEVRECGESGRIDVFDCGSADLLSFVSIPQLGADRGERVNDVWGWTDPETSREYAIVGRTNGTSFIDITDPVNPVLVGRLPRTEGSSGSTWRDIKTYANHAFVVSESNGQGIQVFDLTRLRDASGAPVVFDEDAHYDGISSAHNIVINEETGFAYSVGSGGGGETCGGGLHMVDIRNPTNPTFAGCFADAGTGRRGTGYSHDAMCVVYRGPDADYQGHEICFGANETAISLADVTDKSNPVAISRATYPKTAYAHQGWITEDHRYFFVNDESDELQEEFALPGTRTMVYDITDLDDPQLVEEFIGTTQASDHNLYIRGDLMYQSNYLAGLRVIDVSDPVNPVEVSYFDTVPFGENNPGMSGSWSNFPFFPSGTIVVTSGYEGLFVVRADRPIS